MNIRISEQHGVNPAMNVCLFCGETKDLLLLGKLTSRKREQMFGKGHENCEDRPGDVKAPRKVVLDPEPCDACKKGMAMGVALIRVEGKESNPMPTGQFVVIKEEAASRLPFNPESIGAILSKKKAFIDAQTWELLGFNELPEKRPDKA